MEPNYTITNIIGAAIPFAFYYIGIIIRKIAWPGATSPPLHHQCLLGIPMSLVVVSPMLPVLTKTYADLPALLVTLGIIIEQGMILNETVARRLKKLLENP